MRLCALVPAESVGSTGVSFSNVFWSPLSLINNLSSVRAMSSPSQSPASDSSTRFKSILDDGLTEYQKKTKKKPLNYWLATELKSCESIDDVLDILRDQAKAVERTSAADQS